MKTLLTFLLSLTFLFLFSGSVYGEELQDAIDAYQKQDWKEAVKWYHLPLCFHSISTHSLTRMGNRSITS